MALKLGHIGHWKKGIRVLNLANDKVQSKSIIVEKSIIVDNLPSTDDFYLIKIQNSRNSKIVEGFFGKVA